MTISQIDIKKLLTELRATGLTDGAIGRQVSAPAQTINRLRHGMHKTTTASRAIAIANYYSLVMGKASP